MTRKNDDKMGNNEFGDYDDAEYNRKVEARWTKEANAKQGQNGYPSREINPTHHTDGKRY